MKPGTAHAVSGFVVPGPDPARRQKRVANRGRGQYNATAYVQRRKALKAKAQRDNTPCWICGRPFLWDVGFNHPKAFTADHIEPVGLGGHMLGELKPAHKGCNSRRGMGRETSKPAIVQPRTNREWFPSTAR